jgi:hypothetical protein
MPYVAPAYAKPTIHRDIAVAHPVLARKVTAVLSDVNGHLDTTKVRLAVFEVLRSLARQIGLKAAGKSRTLASKHRTGRAADLVFQVFRHGRWEWSWDASLPWHLLDSARDAHGLERLGFEVCHTQLPDSIL